MNSVERAVQRCIEVIDGSDCPLNFTQVIAISQVSRSYSASIKESLEELAEAGRLRRIQVGKSVYYGSKVAAARSPKHALILNGLVALTDNTVTDAKATAAIVQLYKYVSTKENDERGE